MPEIKTKASDASVQTFLEGVADPKQREDALKLVDIMREVTGAEPVMWGTSIIGFGSSRYHNPGGSKGDWFIAGFSPRKKDLTLYLMGVDMDDTLLAQLGKYKTGKACLYIRKLDDVNLDTLKNLVSTTADRYKKSMES